MRRLVLHLLVALLAFFVGIAAAMLLGGAASRPRVERCPTANAVFYTTAEERPPLAPFHHSCPNARAFTVTPLSDEPLPPAPPMPPTGAKEREVRIRIMREDGKVRIIKTVPAESR